MQRALGIVAAGTGEGKTLVGLAFARALARARYAVMPFKIGPDFLDARLYEHACGVRARNLDLYLDGQERVRTELAQAHGAVVIEGMMGLFDGDDAGETSSAHVLALADVPTLLVVDGWRMSQSAAAVAIGCATMEPRVRLRGVVLNRCGGAAHERAVRRACEAVGIPLLATLPYDASWTMPERHLGLVVERSDAFDAMLDAVADALAAQVDLHEWFGAPQAPRAAVASAAGPRIAVAADDALWFTYPQTLDALAALAEPVPFSPLRDRALPPGTRGIWLGGGYPELHGAALEGNGTMREALRAAARDGLPIYAECGGLMYLADRLDTAHGSHAMAGVLRGATTIAQPRLTIGYRDTYASRATILDDAGDRVRGYEFHYATSTLEEPPAYDGPGDRGAVSENVLASFIHRRFFPGDRTIWRFVERCAR
ncbi:MAG: cobyrinate a,c-diamide synthase [bacterium]|nr:cobyrinate a,c-diamide synthase [bacterium]